MLWGHFTKLLREHGKIGDASETRGKNRIAERPKLYPTALLNMAAEYKNILKLNKQPKNASLPCLLLLFVFEMLEYIYEICFIFQSFTRRR